MRSTAFALFALFSAMSIAPAQPPAAPGTPTAASPADPAKLDSHLAAWEKSSGSLTNFRVDVALTRKDAVREKVLEFKGSLLCMTPTFVRLRLEHTADPKDYEEFICNGKSVYVYSGLAKTVTEYKLPDPKANSVGASDNVVLDFLFGMKAKGFKERFDIQLLAEDTTYVNLDIKPTLARDKQEFQQLRLALFGPKSKTPYLPAQIIMAKPNGESEDWKFSNPGIDNPGISAKDFQYVEVKEFTRQRAPERP